MKTSIRNGIILCLLIFSLLEGDANRQEMSRKARYECKCQQKYKKKAKKGYIQCPKHKYRYYERPYYKKNCFQCNKSYYYAPYYDPNCYYFNKECKKKEEPYFYFN